MTESSGQVRVEAQNTQMRIGICGGDAQAASFLRLLEESSNVEIVAVCDENEYSPAMREAESLGLTVVTNLADMDMLHPVDLIIDLTPDSFYCRKAGLRPSGGAVLAGGSAVELIRDLLVTREQYRITERLYEDLQIAYSEIRQDQHRLRTNEETLVKANERLERHLAEIFFMHEYSRALTTFQSVNDITSLIVDGTNGMLGAEISAIYLLDQEHWVFNLGACQGRSEDFFRTEIPLAESILGAAFREGFVQQSDIQPGSELIAWATYPGQIRSHAATPLRAGDLIAGVLLVGSASTRQLHSPEIDRLQGIAQQSSLALHNALLHEKLERLSVTDRLTGLFNHGHLYQRLDKEIVRASRFGRNLSVIMLDIDDFKQFNDRFGHPQGDAVLKTVGSILKQNLREIDIAARYGGEEFVVVLPESDVAGAMAVAERIRTSVCDYAHPLEMDDHSIQLTVSLGVASYPAHASTSAALIEAADQAMYVAKRSGKNQVVASS